MLVQTICYGGAAGRGVWVDLFALQPGAVTSLTNLIRDDKTRGWDLVDEEAYLRIFRVGNQSIAVSSELWSKITLIDLAAAGKIGVDLPLIDGTLLTELRVTADGRHLLQLNSDGRFFVHRIADGKRVLIGADIDDEIVVANEEGLYDSTYEGAQTVQVRFAGSNGLFRFNQFEAALHRKGLAADVLSGKSVAPPSAVTAPPTVELTLAVAPINGRRTGKVVASAEDSLSAIRFYSDGRLISEVPVKGARVDIPVDLPDPGGGRWITAVSVDRLGLLSHPSAVQLPGAPRPRGTMRAIVVGVDTYQDRSLPQLRYAKSDAQRFAHALTASRDRAVQTVQTTVLLDSQVTPANVLAAIREAVQAMKPDDILIIFYAGHGLDGRSGGQSEAGLVLTTPATQTTDLQSTAILWSTLSELVAEGHGTIVVVLDACHAGIAGNDTFATNDDAVSALITRAGAPMVVLAGSKGRQQSIESAEAGGGLFTAAIAGAISEARTVHDRDRSGLIDLGELYSAVKTRVFQATRGQQTPWLTRNALVGEMALF